jgi:hypothetical protein
MTAYRPSRYDQDPEAIAWARAKVQAEMDRADEFATQAAAVADPGAAARWAFLARTLRRTFLGDTGSCVMGRFDERLPALHRAIDRSILVDSLDIALDGGCGHCDTVRDHLCVGCGKCRCFDHDTCARPTVDVPATGAGR